MFQVRSREVDPVLAAIAGTLRAIEKELGRVGQSAGRTTAVRATAAGNQIVDAIVPVLNDILDHFGRGQRAAVDEAVSFWDEAFKIGTKMGSNALEKAVVQTKKRLLVTLAVAMGLGILIGMASRRR